MHEITATWEKLVQDSAGTAGIFLSAAHGHVTTRLKVDPKKQPDLYAALVRVHVEAAGHDFRTTGMMIACKQLTNVVTEMGCRS